MLIGTWLKVRHITSGLVDDKVAFIVLKSSSLHFHLEIVVINANPLTLH